MQHPAKVYNLRVDRVRLPDVPPERNYIMRKLYWRLYRLHRKLVFKLLASQTKRYGWHNTVLDSNIPNVKCLRLKSITVVNQYNQEHTHTF